jgi:3-methyladenine DNA glycosylase AlkD
MHAMTQFIQQQLQGAAEPDKASPMQAYMKTTQPFYGVQATPRRKLFRAAAKQFSQLSSKEYEQVILELWQGSHRELMYQALEVAQHYKAHFDEKSWKLYTHLVHTATWWDTLDWIASGIIGPIIQQHRKHEADLIKWSNSDNLWVRRASLLAHLKHKSNTNVKLLSETILKLCHEQEFFIRKAIGWVLREYSKTDGAWVESFVKQHDEKLSGLSKREALKYLARKRSTA